MWHEVKIRRLHNEGITRIIEKLMKTKSTKHILFLVNFIFCCYKIIFPKSRTLVLFCGIL